MGLSTARQSQHECSGIEARSMEGGVGRKKGEGVDRGKEVGTGWAL